MCVCMQMHTCMPSLKIKQEINGQKNVYAITYIVNQLQPTAPTAHWKLKTFTCKFIMTRNLTAC